MAKPSHQIIMLIFAAVLVAGCAAAPMSQLPTSVPPTFTSPPTAVSPTPIVPPPTTALTAEPPTEIPRERGDSMKIKITIENTELTATLIDCQTTQDFISLLPLTLTLEDYGGTEKISYLPERLSTEGAPAGMDPSVGDITYYAPWGNMAIFIHDFGYSSELVLLGKFDGDMKALNVPVPVSVTIELIK